MTSLWDDLKLMFRTGGSLTQLILVNCTVFVIYGLISLIGMLFVNSDIANLVYNQLAVPSSVSRLLTKPWTLFTYMFFHEGLFHLGFNMLTLFWFGQIVQDMVGQKRLIPLYLIGGLAGAFLYVLCYNVFPGFQQVVSGSTAIGASAGVLAIVVASATIAPDYEMMLLFFGRVKLKYLALVMVLIDFLSISRGNAGGHIAHIGGAIAGYFFIKQLQQGNDWGKYINKAIDYVVTLFHPGPKVVHSSKRPVTNSKVKNLSLSQEQIDRILDKISASGYDSLTKEEKELLFKASKD